MEKAPAVLTKFAKKLRIERLKRGFSQETLAAAAGVSRNYIGMIERGESNLTLGTMDQIARAMRMEVWELVKFN
jgi:transcriptional regulator with XRE-family HTH domain